MSVRLPPSRSIGMKDGGCIYLGSPALLLMRDRSSLLQEVDIWSHHIRLDPLALSSQYGDPPAGPLDKGWDPISVLGHKLQSA